MKLKHKISISILLVSLTALLICSYYLINRNHLDNISREQERSRNDLELIRNSLENSLDLYAASDENLQLLLTRYEDYYTKRNIHLMLYHNKKPVYSDFHAISRDQYSNLLSVAKNTKKIQVLSSSNQFYIFVSCPLNKAGYTLIYARNISDIYIARNDSVNLSILLVISIIVILIFLSNFYSRWITKPMEELNKGANAISNGDYSIRIRSTKDEFNELVSAYNQMAAAIECRTKELEDKANELQTFIDDLSHEMNTPLTSIQGYSEFLINANTNEVQRNKAADTIRKEAKRMNDIYTKLLTLSLVREYKADFSYVNIATLFEELWDTFRPILLEKSIKFIKRCSIESIYADRILIYMLLSNLIKNSIQSIHNDGCINLNAYEENGNPILEIRDDGCGIPADKINDVIKPFYRVDKSRSRKTGGAGLGLAICKNITELHNAKFLITSDINKGTMIKIIFYNSVTTS